VKRTGRDLSDLLQERILYPDREPGQDSGLTGGKKIRGAKRSNQRANVATKRRTGVVPHGSTEPPTLGSIAQGQKLLQGDTVAVGIAKGLYRLVKSH
jgi:hypothetical protein